MFIDPILEQKGLKVECKVIRNASIVNKDLDLEEAKKCFICYLDIKQCDQTKITKQTQEFLVYVQGNETTSQDHVNSILHEVVETIQRYCGGAVI